MTMKELKFSTKLFEFLQELKSNNNREWYEQNRGKYTENVRDPFLAFIAAFRPRLNAISPWLIADPKPVGGSMLRIYRDVRFSKSKVPYKTNAAAFFYHQAGKENTPGIYLHLEPGSSFLGIGLWQPDTANRRKITDSIYNNPTRWGDVVTDRKFKKSFKLAGDSLSKVPKHYSGSHPFPDDLRRKDFIVTSDFSERQVCEKDFIERVEDLCITAAPFMQFLTEALEIPWRKTSKARE